MSSLTQTSKKAECSEEILVHTHHHSMIPTGSNALNKTPLCKGMDTTQDQEATMDKDRYELHIWCHHDASSKFKLGKTHVTLFQEKICSQEDVHPSSLGRQNETNPSLLSLSAGTDLKKPPPLKTV